MGGWTFNRRQCNRALRKLGFFLSNQRSGKHDKYYAPFSCDPPFIMVPRHNQLHCQDEIVAEVFKMGGRELVDKFKEYSLNSRTSDFTLSARTNEQNSGVEDVTVKVYSSYFDGLQDEITISIRGGDVSTTPVSSGVNPPSNGSGW